MDSIAPLFDLGAVVATPGAMAALERNEQKAEELLIRHVTGDWDNLPTEDIHENWLSLKYGYRIFSMYHLDDGTKIYVITEWDRSLTTLLRSEEY